MKRPPELIDDLPFWQYCAEKYGDPILDLCCGNGRIAIPLAELGYEVIGVEINKDFISSAERRLMKISHSGTEIRASFRLMDIVNLDLKEDFRLAIMPDWSFQVLLTQEDQISFMRSLNCQLLEGGAFAFNTFIPFYRQRSLVEKDGKYIWPPKEDYHRGASRRYDVVSQVEDLIESNLHFIKLRHTNLSELRLLFRMTGFKIKEMYGSNDMRPFTGNKENDYTIIAEKLRIPE